MSTLIECNGSAAQRPIEYLYKNLANYTLDPVFAAIGEVYEKLADIDSGAEGNTWINDGKRPEKYEGYTYIFSGNFYRLSAVFRILTSDPVVISTLIDLIDANLASEDFIKVSADLIEREAENEQRRLNKAAAKQAEAVKQAKNTLRAARV